MFEELKKKIESMISSILDSANQGLDFQLGLNSINYHFEIKKSNLTQTLKFHFGGELWEYFSWKGALYEYYALELFKFAEKMGFEGDSEDSSCLSFTIEEVEPAVKSAYRIWESMIELMQACLKSNVFQKYQNLSTIEDKLYDSILEWDWKQPPIDPYPLWNQFCQIYHE